MSAGVFDCEIYCRCGGWLDRYIVGDTTELRDPETDERTERCPNCGALPVETTEERCDHCKGEGCTFIWGLTDICHVCDGTGVLRGPANAGLSKESPPTPDGLRAEREQERSDDGDASASPKHNPVGGESDG